MLKGRQDRPIWTMLVDAGLTIVTVLGVARLIQIQIVTGPFGFVAINPFDSALALGLIVATLEAARRTIGPALSAIAVVAFLYALFGHDLPGRLSHMHLSPQHVFNYLGFTTEGIWGVPLRVSSTVVILFLIFASLMRTCGLLDFLTDFSQAVVGRFRGGVAKVSLVASAMMAMMSGSAVANVAATGSFTIPLMKRTGYDADFAGAVESCASTGGIVTPPVMGAAAFIIAEYLGISYWAVCVAAVLPAFLYYLGVYVGIDMETVKRGLKGLPREQVPSVWRVSVTKGYLMVPVGVLIYFLAVVRGSAMIAVFWSIVSLLVLALIRKETRERLLGYGFVEGLAGGIKDFLVVVTACSCAGIVVGTLTSTGLGTRLTSLMLALSGQDVILLLLLCALIAMVLGMGMTTTSVYLLVAIILAPALIRLGVNPLAAHLAVLFYGNLSHITPPVMLSVYMACGISGGRPWPTAWHTLKLGAIIFFIPFFFALNPSLVAQGTPFEVARAFGTAVVGTIALASALSNRSWLGEMNVVQRVAFGLGGLALIYPSPVSSAVGGVLVLIGSLRSLVSRRFGTRTS